MLGSRLSNSVFAPRRGRGRAPLAVVNLGNFGSLFSIPKMKGCEVGPKEPPAGKKFATFAGGCFWGLELAFQRVPGVEATSIGYTAGTATHVTYDDVCSGSTGHTEAVRCVYDPSEVTFSQLIDTFLEKTDVTQLNRQGNDRGTQYRSGIYFHDEEQRKVAQERFAEVNAKLAAGEPVMGRSYSGRKVVAELLPAGDFYVGEEYHQQYLSKGGRFGKGQSAAKGCKDPIRCYG